jgi:hypothetical protein
MFLKEGEGNSFQRTSILCNFKNGKLLTNFKSFETRLSIGIQPGISIFYGRRAARQVYTKETTHSSESLQ